MWDVMIGSTAYMLGRHTLGTDQRVAAGFWVFYSVWLPLEHTDRIGDDSGSYARQNAVKHNILGSMVT